MRKDVIMTLDRAPREYLTANPAQGVRTPKVPKNLPRHLRADGRDLVEVFDKIGRSSGGFRYRRKDYLRVAHRLLVVLQVVRAENPDGVNRRAGFLRSFCAPGSRGAPGRSGC